MIELVNTVLSFVFGPWPFLVAGIWLAGMGFMNLEAVEPNLAKMGIFCLGIAAILWNLQH